MRTTIQGRLLFLLLAGGIAGCDGRRLPGPGPSPGDSAPPVPPPVVEPVPAFHTADVNVSGLVYELTPAGRVPIEGVGIANGEGAYVVTDAVGVFRFRPVWVCPCAAQPWVEAGITALWIGKEGYADPPGQPGSSFGVFSGPGWRDVKINGDTRLEVQLMRR